MAKKPVMLMILDGWGIAPAGPYNAATTAQIIQTQSWRPAGKMWGCRQAR